MVHHGNTHEGGLPGAAIRSNLARGVHRPSQPRLHCVITLTEVEGFSVAHLVGSLQLVSVLVKVDGTLRK